MSRETLSAPDWCFARRLPDEELQSWCAVLDLAPVIVQILRNRGLSLDEARTFLDDGSAAGSGADPYLFRDMPPAVARIKRAVVEHERITVYGDYDVDGICGTALLTIALRALGANVDHYIPHRANEGYGLHRAAIDILHTRGTGLIITVDCGVMGHAEVAYAGELGIDVIVTDHHRCPHDDIFPVATAILHSKIGGYPNPDLTGSGVAWKLVVALVHELGATVDADRLLDLVTLGTICDVAPLKGENRMLVRRGLQLLQSPDRRLGLDALLRAARTNNMARLTTTTIGFTLGPRLNAAGRIESPEIAYRLLISQDQHEAEELAEQLDQLNRQRQTIVRALEAEIEAELKIQPDLIPPLIWIERPDIPLGIAGLIAGNLSKRYYRPVIALERGEDLARGSTRSIPEIDIMQVLDRCAEYLSRYGGHATAAGLSVESARVDLLRAHLTEACALMLTNDMRPRLAIDAKVRLSSLTWELYHSLQRLEPFGQGNHEPVFATQGAVVQKADGMSGGKHLRLRLSDGNGTTRTAIGWNMGAQLEQLHPGSILDIAYTLEENTYNGNSELRLLLEGLHIL